MNSTAKRQENTTRQICMGAIIAALYVLLTYMSAILGLDKGVVQFRLSESLCIFAIFTPYAVPGLTIGCLIANLLCGAMAYDVIFGTIATFLGAVGVYLLKKIPYVAPLAYVISNALIIPFVLRYAYGADGVFWLLLLTVGIGEIICGYFLGILLYRIIKNSKLKTLLIGTGCCI